MKTLSPPNVRFHPEELYDVLVLVDGDDTQWPHFDPWIKRMGMACDPPIVPSEAHWDSFWKFPTILEGKKLQANYTLPSGRVTTGNEHFIEGTESTELGVTKYEFLDPTIYKDLEVFPGAAEAIAKVAAMPRVKVLCVTAHPRTVSHEPNDPTRLAFEGMKKEIIKKHVPALSEEHIIFTHEKDKLVGKTVVTLLIDDNPDNIAAVMKAGGHGILINRPWNLKADVGNAIRVDHLAEAVSHIESISLETQNKKRTARRERFSAQYSRLFHSETAPQKGLGLVK